MIRGESVVFIPHGDTRELSGQFQSEDPGCGVTVYGWADGRRYFVADVRPETDAERRARELDGYYAEDLARSPELARRFER